MTQDDDGPQRGRESPQGNGTSSRNIRLSSSHGSAPTLTWTSQGLEDACGYKLYRTDVAGAKHLLAVLDASARSYVDTSAVDGIYEYFVQAIDPSGADSVRSNSSFITIIGGCDWVSVSPFGFPPVLVHPECL